MKQKELDYNGVNDYMKHPDIIWRSEIRKEIHITCHIKKGLFEYDLKNTGIFKQNEEENFFISLLDGMGKYVIFEPNSLYQEDGKYYLFKGNWGKTVFDCLDLIEEQIKKCNKFKENLEREKIERNLSELKPKKELNTIELINHFNYHFQS